MIEKPVMSGEKIKLRPITGQDAEVMFASLSDEESMRLTGTQQAFTFAQVEAYCQRIETAVDRADYAIIRQEDGLYVGEVVLNNIDWQNRSANFRIALAGQAHFGKGYGSEATRLILHYGFGTLNLHRIELEVFDFNPRARHVYEKAGFVREGVRRDVLLWDGKYHDALVMSILEDEFWKDVDSGKQQV